jgi:hypothetical protein
VRVVFAVLSFGSCGQAAGGATHEPDRRPEAMEIQHGARARRVTLPHALKSRPPILPCDGETHAQPPLTHLGSDEGDLLHGGVDHGGR